MEHAMQRWMICEVWLSLDIWLGNAILMFCSWSLRRILGWNYDLSHRWFDHMRSVYTDRDYTIVLLNMDACDALYQTMGAKTVCSAPRPSFSGADLSIVSSASSS